MNMRKQTETVVPEPSKKIAWPKLEPSAQQPEEFKRGKLIAPGARGFEEQVHLWAGKMLGTLDNDKQNTSKVLESMQSQIDELKATVAALQKK